MLFSWFFHGKSSLPRSLCVSFTAANVNSSLHVAKKTEQKFLKSPLNIFSWPVGGRFFAFRCGSPLVMACFCVFSCVIGELLARTSKLLTNTCEKDNRSRAILIFNP